MNAKNISLTLAALAALSTTAAFADEVVVNPVGSVVNTTANVVTAPIRATNSLVHSMFHPMGPIFDLSVMGRGISVGGSRRIVEPAVSSGDLRVLTNAAVIPGNVVMGRAVPVSENISAPGHVLDFALFGFGIHAGRVPKSLDMR